MARSSNRKNRVLRVPDLNLRNLSRIESNVSLALALGPATFRPTSSVAKLSALGDDFHQIAYSLESGRARAQVRTRIPLWKIRKIWRTRHDSNV